MTIDLTCPACAGDRTKWVTTIPRAGDAGTMVGVPCPKCDGTGVLHLRKVALDVARAHGTRVAADFTGLSDQVIVGLRKTHDGYDRGRGRPSRAEMEAARPRLDCPCAFCVHDRTLNPPAPAAQEADDAWRDLAACQGIDPDLFFPSRGAATADAKAVCAGCDVRQECLDYALDRGERFGIWGGKSERQRRRLRRGKQAVA